MTGVHTTGVRRDHAYTGPSWRDGRDADSAVGQVRFTPPRSAHHAGAPWLVPGQGAAATGMVAPWHALYGCSEPHGQS